MNIHNQGNGPAPASSLGSRVRGQLAAWRHGGAPNAWSLALWWTFSNDETLSTKGRRLAKYLYDAQIASTGMEPGAFSHAIDIMLVIRDPQDTEWSSPEAREEGLRIWKTFEMVLERGFDVNYCHYNNYRDTPVHRAAVAGRVYLTKLLLRHGADPNARDGNGYTALASTLTGFAEKVGIEENREKTARLLLDHPDIDLTRGRERRTYYKISEDEVRKYEESLLALTTSFPELLVDIAKRGAPLELDLVDYEGGRRQVPGDQSIGHKRHALFLLDHEIWSTNNEIIRSAWIDFLHEKEGDLAKLRSHRGFTPAMEFISNNVGTVSGKSSGISEEAQIEAVRASVQYFMDKGVFNLTDTTEGGSNIWHALLLKVDSSTLVTVKALMEHFPETHPLLNQENEGGVSPRDIACHYIEGSPEHIRTRTGAVLATSRTHYDKSWHETFRAILTVINRQSLCQHVVADVERKEPGPTNRPRL